MSKEKKVSDKKASELLKEATEAAKQVLNDPQKLNETLEKLSKKIKNSKTYETVIDDLELFISLIKSYIKKEYTEIPLRSILAIIGTVLYIVNPFDFIPDVLPIIGEIDDIAVIYACLKIVDKDLKKYQAWREANEK